MKALFEKLRGIARAVAAWYQNEPLTLFNSGPAGSGVALDIPVYNRDASGLHLIIDVTNNNLGGGAGSITVTIQGVDPASGKKYTILASAAIVAIGTTVLRVGRGLTAAANAVANDMIPEKFNVNIAVGNANPMVYTIGAQLIR